MGEYLIFTGLPFLFFKTIADNDCWPCPFQPRNTGEGFLIFIVRKQLFNF